MSRKPAVLYFHGWPACRTEAGLIGDLPIRLLAADRPGYGRSSPRPGRTLLDAAGDAQSVADHFGLRRFYAVGLSGGAPFAAATAAALGERVAGLALINPLPPQGMGSDAIDLLHRLGRNPVLARVTIGAGRLLTGTGTAEMRLLLGAGLPAADRVCLTHDVLVGLRQVWREALRNGVGGAVADAVALAAPWGFALDEVAVPTTIWSGSEDQVIPSASAAAYAAIPGARLDVVAGEGHYSLPLRHARRILCALTGEGQAASDLV